PIALLLVISIFLNNFADYAIVKNAFAGVRVCVCVLILNAVERLWKKSMINHKALLIFVVVLGLTLFTDIPLYVIVLSSSVVGALLNRWKGAEAK
ncbi:MAG: chromate transporter, partial [Coprobacillus cateniformis]